MNEQHSANERSQQRLGVPIAVGIVVLGIVLAVFWQSQLTLAPAAVVGIMALFLVVPAVVIIAIAHRQREH